MNMSNNWSQLGTAYIAAICGTHHKVKVALVVIKRGVMSRQHSAFEYCVGRTRSRTVHVASNLKHNKQSMNAIRALHPLDNKASSIIRKEIGI